MNKATVFLGLILVGGAIYVTADESPSLLAQEMAIVGGEERDTDSKAYRIIMGMAAAVDEDALEVGDRIIESYQAASVDAAMFDDVQFDRYPDEDRIHVPTDDEHELYCLIPGAGCLDTILLDDEGRRAELQRLGKLSERYTAYLAAGDFQTPTKISLHEPWPDYRFAVVANRMEIFKSIETAAADDIQGALTPLLEQTVQLRELLAASDSLVHKLITASSIRDNLEAIAYLHSIFEGPAIQPIPSLSREEASFEKPLVREYWLVAGIAEELDGNPTMLTEEYDTPGWVANILFHPNKVKNAAAEEINALIKLSHVSPSEFELALQTTIPTERNFFSVVPSVSAAMSDIGFADYSDYVGRVFDLNVKIALVNAQITGDPDSLVNPYYPGPGPSLHSVDTAICMDGPLPDERNFRCLNVISVPTEMVSRID